MAERYPNARITAVSNSHSQRAHITAQAPARGLSNIPVITCDVNALELSAESFDRVVSVEMFEHVRDYAALLQNNSHWLRRYGPVVVHSFRPRHIMYSFDI